MGDDDSDRGHVHLHGRRAHDLPAADGALGRPRRRVDPGGGPMSAAAATIPMLIVVLAAIAALLAEAIRHPGERMYIAGFGLIGLGGAAVASIVLWDADATSFGVVRADNFALFVNLVLCVIGILTMIFSNHVVE